MPIEKIVIVGGGVAGWLSAAALARNTACSVTVIETPGIDDSLGLPLRIEPTLPSTPAMHKALGLDEDFLFAQAGGSFTLGRATSNWTAAQTPSFQPYGEIGASLGPVAFHQLVARMRAAGQTVNLANYSVAALCAQAGRFAKPVNDLRSVLSTMAYGHHLESKGYRDALKASALADGAVAHDGQVGGMKLSGAGLIEAIHLLNGQNIDGDLFLDCSGQSRVLIDQMPGAAFEDWSHWLPCNRCVATASPATSTPMPFTHVDAHDSGWQCFTSSRNVVGDAFIYRNDQTERGAYAFTSGRMTQPWIGNCVAIGGAAAVIDPVASTQLHLAGSGVMRLLKLFPYDRSTRIEATEYNRQTADELQNVRDFAILHYKANGRLGDPFWDECRAVAVPDRLAHKITLFENTGRMALYDEESFEAADWIALFDAVGIHMRHYDVMADGIAVEKIGAYMQQIRNAMLKAVATLPTHAQYLSSYPKARA